MYKTPMSRGDPFIIPNNGIEVLPSRVQENLYLPLEGPKERREN